LTFSRSAYWAGFLVVLRNWDRAATGRLGNHILANDSVACVPPMRE